MRAKLRNAVIVVAVAAALASASSAGTVTNVRSWHFDVLLDGKRIGDHEFLLTDHGQQQELRTRASFRVSVLLLPLYRYEHWTRELWRDGCLLQIDARTRENGAELSVKGERSGDIFEVRGPEGIAQLDGCVKSFAYWEPAIVRERRLLNAQTGVYETVTVSSMGSEILAVSGRQIAAERHSLRAGKFTIDVWYSSDGDWVALESVTPEGRKLRYQAR